MKRSWTEQCRPRWEFGLLVAFALAGCTDRGEPIAPPEPETVPPPFRSAKSCGACHPNHLAEWEASMHAFGSSDPLMLAMSDMAVDEVGEEKGGSCKRCHSPSLTRQERWLAAGNVPDEEHPMEDLQTDGVSCDVCHSIQIVPPIGNIDFLDQVDPHSPKLAGISDPVPNSFHESREDDSFRTSIQCASCHQLNLEDGTGVENTYNEWDRSILSGMGIQCQDCHMPAYQGQASVDGPVRTVHRHHFVGVDYAYEPFRGVDLAAQKEAIRNLLRNSVTATLNAPPAVSAGGTLSVNVAVTNSFTGHSIPSGVSFAREMWIQLEVKDANGADVHVSGRPVANGDLPNDPDLAYFGSILKDANGDRTFFTFRAASIDESKLIPDGATRVSNYSIAIPLATPGPLTVDATLRFRPVPPSLVRDLDLERLLPIEIFDMWTSEATVAVN